VLVWFIGNYHKKSISYIYYIEVFLFSKKSIKINYPAKKPGNLFRRFKNEKVIC